MRYNDFVEQVAETNPSGSHRDAAHGAAQAVLEALNPHLARPDAAALAAQLPAELGAALDASGADPAAAGDPDLPARVSERVGVGRDEAAGYVRAVGAALGDTLDADAYERVMGALPEVVRAQLT